ncbi:MAG: hypothetical protein IPJ98_28505 [Bryobacterales bacterium]|nr:hypothetical protein [Bryobacterales bacterium]
MDRDGTVDIIANSGQATGAFPNSIAWFKTRGVPAQGKLMAKLPVWQRNVLRAGTLPGPSHSWGAAM